MRSSIPSWKLRDSSFMRVPTSGVGLKGSGFMHNVSRQKYNSDGRDPIKFTGESMKKLHMDNSKN